MVIDTAIKHLIDDDAWRIPERLITRENKEVDTSGYIWDLPLPTKKSARINFKKIKSPELRLALMYYVVERIQHVSTDSGFKTYWDVWRTILANYNESSTQHQKTLTHRLIFLFEASISKKNPNTSYMKCIHQFSGISFVQRAILS